MSKKQEKYKWLTAPVDDLEKSIFKLVALNNGILPLTTSNSEVPAGLTRETRRKFRKLWRQAYFDILKNYKREIESLSRYHLPGEEPGFARARSRERLVIDKLAREVCLVLNRKDRLL